ncbi:hypothetical protein L13192_00142 [Pyrenophora tritici-repentis]|nr:hypothetical protein L13192_00142 [Pyrenophora tritici-repentis]
MGSATPHTSSDFRPSTEFRARTPEEGRPQRLPLTDPKDRLQCLRERLKGTAKGLAWGATADHSSSTVLLPPQGKTLKSDSVRKIWEDDRHPSVVAGGHHTQGSANASTVLPQCAPIYCQNETPYRAGNTSTISPSPAAFVYTNAQSSRPVQSIKEQGTRSTGPLTSGHPPKHPPASTVSRNWRQRDNSPYLDPVQPNQHVQRQFPSTKFTRPQAPLQASYQALSEAPSRALPPQVRQHASLQVPPLQVRPQAPPQPRLQSTPQLPPPPPPQPQTYQTAAPPYIPACISYNPQPAARYPEPPNLGTRSGQFPPAFFEALLSDAKKYPDCPGCKQEMHIDCPNSLLHMSWCTRGRWCA